VLEVDEEFFFLSDQLQEERESRKRGWHVCSPPSVPVSQSVNLSVGSYVLMYRVRRHARVFWCLLSTLVLHHLDGVSSSSLPCGTRLARRQMFHLSEGLAATGVEAG
jgi:hypothetical protein